MKLTKEERTDIKKIRGLLEVAFLWEGTPQGRKYWERVNIDLKNLLKVRKHKKKQ